MTLCKSMIDLFPHMLPLKLSRSAAYILSLLDSCGHLSAEDYPTTPFLSLFDFLTSFCLTRSFIVFILLLLHFPLP